MCISSLYHSFHRELSNQLNTAYSSSFVNHRGGAGFVSALKKTAGKILFLKFPKTAITIIIAIIIVIIVNAHCLSSLRN